MSNLPSVNKKLIPLAVEIEVMRRGRSNERYKPHKLFLLLSVLDLFDQGLITENKIYFNQQLIDGFEKYFRLYAEEDDWCQVAPPFFHLRNSSFWMHKIKTGRESTYSKLTSSGGGNKRIQDNIEYAYLNEYVYTLLIDDRLRRELHNFILSLLKVPQVSNHKGRIPTLFHESFSLSRTSVLQILDALQSIPKNFDIRSKTKREVFFREHTHLGTNYVKSMPEYAKGTGLIDFDFNLTNFGEIAINTDKLLEHSGTQWLMHYYLSAPHGPGPAFWHELVTSRFRSGDEFAQEEIALQIGEIFFKNEGKPLSPRSATTTANIFLETYLKSDALGNLGLIEETSKNCFRVLDPDLPPTWAVAVAVLDFWQAQFPGQATINLNDLYGEKGLTNLFMIGKGRLNTMLEEMQQEGMIELYRVAPPYQIVLLWREMQQPLEKLYGTQFAS